MPKPKQGCNSGMPPSMGYAGSGGGASYGGGMSMSMSGGMSMSGSMPAYSAAAASRIRSRPLAIQEATAIRPAHSRLAV